MFFSQKLYAEESTLVTAEPEPDQASKEIGEGTRSIKDYEDEDIRG